MTLKNFLKKKFNKELKNIVKEIKNTEIAINKNLECLLLTEKFKHPIISDYYKKCINFFEKYLGFLYESENFIKKNFQQLTLEENYYYV